MVKSLRTQCIELLTEIEARLHFDDEMPPLDLNLIMGKIHPMSSEVDNALETANYDKLLQSGLLLVNCSFSCLREFLTWHYIFWDENNSNALLIIDVCCWTLSFCST